MRPAASVSTTQGEREMGAGLSSPLRLGIIFLRAADGWRGTGDGAEASGRMQKQDNSEEVREW